MDTDLPPYPQRVYAGSGNIETAVIAVTFRGVYLAAAGRSEQVGRPPARQPACISRTAPPSTHADGRKSGQSWFVNPLYPYGFNPNASALKSVRVRPLPEREDGDVQEVVVGMIVPGGQCDSLVQEVAADHEVLSRCISAEGACNSRLYHTSIGKGRKERLQNRTIKNKLNFIITYKFSR